MAIEGLGRLFNVAASVGGASGTGSAAISLRDGGAVTFICQGADTYTLTSSNAFGGTYSSPGNIIKTCYQNSALAGTAAWTQQPNTPSNAVTQANSNYVTVITVFGSSLPDTHKYVKLTVTGTTGKVTAVVHDLAVMRKPANLPALSA